MQIEYKREMGRNYVLFREMPELEEGYFLRLVQNSPVEGLLSLEVRVVDGRREYLCDVTGKQSLKAVLERGGLDKEQLEEIIAGIQDILQRGEEYLLKPEDFCLAAEAVFLEQSDFSLSLCYFPGYQRPMEEKWKDFTEELMNAIEYKKEETVLYVYSLYKAARQPEGLELWQERQEAPEIEEKTVVKKISAPMPELEERIEEDAIVEAYPVKTYLMAAAVVAIAAVAAAAGLFIWRPAPIQAAACLLFPGLLAVYGLSILFSPERKESRLGHQVEFIPVEEQEEENTMILAAEPEKRSSLLRAEDGCRYQDIELIEFPFFFGKLRTRVNSTIESPAVSRFHAKIEYLGGEYYLVDLNSTNGTYLNGKRLTAQERNKLMPGDKIQFADVGYFFAP